MDFTLDNLSDYRGALARDLFFDLQTKATRQFPPTLREVARRKLQYLNAAISVGDLRVPPGNRLEALKRKSMGLYSIRVNDQWRIVFRWEQGAHEVEVTDYHSGSNAPRQPDPSRPNDNR